MPIIVYEAELAIYVIFRCFVKKLNDQIIQTRISCQMSLLLAILVHVEDIPIYYLIFF